MSRRTPTEDLKEEESEIGTPSRRRSSRIAAAVTTRRASATAEEDTPAKITKSKRLSLSQESSLEKDDPKTSSRDPSTPQKKIATRNVNKSPTLSKIEESKDTPATRTRRRASTSSIMEEETQKEDRSASPAVAKMTTRRRSLRSISTSPTSEGAPKDRILGTPRKSTRAVSASPTHELTRSAPPKLRGRRPSVTEKIVPLDAIEETEPKTEEMAATKESNENKSPGDEKTVPEETSDVLFKKKKAAMSKTQNLQKITEESDDVAKKGEKFDTSQKEESTVINDKSLKELSGGMNEASKESANSSVTTADVKTPEKKAPKRENVSPETPESKSKTAKLSLSLKSKHSPRECVEETELKAVLNVDEKQSVRNTPRRSPRLPSSDSGGHDKTKQPPEIHEDVVNSTASADESLKLNLSQSDASNENVAEEKFLKPPVSQENDLNTSGSSNTSDKENRHQAKVPENADDVSKRKLELLTKNLNLERKSPLVEKILTSESSSQQKPPTRRSAFFEPMEVEDFPSDYEYSGLNKKDETSKTPKPSEQLKSSPKTPTSVDKPKALIEVTKNSPNLLGPSPEENSTGDMVKLDESLSPITKSKMDLSENDVLSVDVPQVKVYPVTTELAKADSPKRRSARLLNQSKTENLEEEPNTVVNSTPKPKPAKKSIEDDVEGSLNETTVSVNEHDLEDSLSVLEECIVDDTKDQNKKKEANVAGDNKMSKSSNKSANVEIIENSDFKSLQGEADQNKSIDGDKIETKEIESTKMKDQESAKHSSLKEAQEKKNEDNSDDEPKFSDDSDTKKDQPNASIKRKSQEFSDGSANKKEASKRDSVSKYEPKNKNSAEQPEDSNEDDEEPKFSNNSKSKDIVKMVAPHETEENSMVKRKSKNKHNSGDQTNSSSFVNLAESHEDLDIGSTSRFKRDSKSRSRKSSEQQRSSSTSKNDEEPQFSEDSDFEVEGSTSANKQNDKSQSSTDRSKANSKSNGRRSFEQQRKPGANKNDQDSQCSEDSKFENSDSDINAPFFLYMVKSNPANCSPNKDNAKSSSKSKKRKSLVANKTPSDSDVEKDTSDLDTKIQSLIASQLNDDSSSSSSYESVTHFLDDLAEEGDEDTPSEGSNDIVDKGESVGSTESEIDSDDTYENDSFIDDNEEADLLSGEEYDLGQEKKKKPKKKPSRIIQVSDSNSEDEIKVTELPAPSKVAEPKEKVMNGIEEDSDLEKMSTQPYCGLTPPSIISLRDSLSDSDKIEAKEVNSSVLINKEDNLKSLEELKQHEISTEGLKIPVDKRKSLQLTPKASENTPPTFTPNNSILEDDPSQSNTDQRRRQSSITIHENIKLEDIAEGSVSDRISKVVDIFCSSVKEDGKDQTGNISLNISLEFLKSPSLNKDDNELDLELNEEKSVGEKLDQATKQPLLEISNKPKSKDVKLLKKTPKKQELEDEDKPAQESVKFLKQCLSSELANDSKPSLEEHLKSSAKKRKATKQQDKLNVTLEDSTGPKKRISKGQVQRTLLEAEKQQQNEEEWETVSDDDLGENMDFIKENARTRQKKRKAISSTETADKTEEEISEVFLSDSDMSKDLDEELNEKYSSPSEEFDEIAEEAELKIIPHVESKKSKRSTKQAQSVGAGDCGSVLTELVKKVKKRKRDKSEIQGGDLNEDDQGTKAISKSKKQKGKAKLTTPEDLPAIPFPHKKSKKGKLSTEYGDLADEVFEEEPDKTSKKKKNRRSPVEETQPKIVADQVPRTKKKKEKIKLDTVSASSSTGKTKFHYFPSVILNTLTKTEKLRKTEEIPGPSNPPKKPKLLPSATMAKASWESDFIDSPLLPSKSSRKKAEADLESFNKKDFKNLMLYDRSRINRMDSKNLLKKKQKTKF